MAKARQVVLSEQQRRELSWVRDHHPKASVRTRAAAILKVADGQSMSQVARTGLLKTVRYETVSDWITRYEQEGLTGFYVQPGRGRKAVFCTVHDDVEVVRADLQGLLSRSPRLYDLPTSRWTLSLLRGQVPWLQHCGKHKKPISLPGLCKLRVSAAHQLQTGAAVRAFARSGVQQETGGDRASSRAV